MEPDLRRIAFVTRRFSGLWGLQSVALGLWLLVLLLQPWIPILDYAQSKYGLLSTGCLVMIVLLRWYYSGRFGRIDRREDNRIWWILWLLVTALVFDHNTYTHGVPSAFFFTLASLSVGIVIRDWPLRVHYGVLALVTLYASLGFAAVTNAATRGAWLGESLFTIAAALIVTGFADHRLLATTLGGIGDERVAARETCK